MNTFAKTCSCAWAAFAASATFAAFAQTSAAPAPPSTPTAAPAKAAEAPDGSPSLTRDTSITHTTAESLPREAERQDGVAESSEERIESRLAVIRSGRTTVTDPNVGRYDRAAGNGVRRVTPSMWQIFRF
jgi:hypothetical protein